MRQTCLILGTVVVLLSAAVVCAQQPGTGEAGDATEKKLLPKLPETVVEGSRNTGPNNVPAPPIPPSPEPPSAGDNLLGVAGSASQGVVGQNQISTMPLSRSSKVLESVPGLVLVQHNAGGDAAVYFLRGFALDHGTDFTTYFDGMPINEPTHAHGQGFLDLNFLMPELIEKIDYYKGPYFVQTGDFSSVGSTSIHTFNHLEQGFVSFEVGSYGFLRTLVADSQCVGQGEFLYALETGFYDGAWVTPEDLQKYNALLKYTLGDECRGVSLETIGYHNIYNAQNQIPARAVQSGLISRLGSIDPSDAGDTQRLGLNLRLWQQEDAWSKTEANAYFMYYTLNLWGNNTYFLDDPVNGDQIEQSERRLTSGFNLLHRWETELGNMPVKNLAGFQFRDDDLPNIALRHTTDRVVRSTVSDDKVREASYGLFYNAEFDLTEKLRPSAGLRGDFYQFNVESDTAANSGQQHAEELSPKLGLSMGPWDKTEYYLNYGQGFHSNDARGVVATIDPNTGLPVLPAPGLAKSKGGEVGLRSQAIDGLNTTVALWYLDLASELIFEGDSGTTVPGRPSHRTGIEWTNRYVWDEQISFDADFAFSKARFTDSDPAGNYVPESAGTVISGGPVYHWNDNWYSSLRMRFFGPRALIEDNSERSDSPTGFVLETGYKRKHFQAVSDVLNLFNSHDHDIDFFYTSRLPGEPLSGVEDFHFHPLEPISARLRLTWSW